MASSYAPPTILALSPSSFNMSTSGGDTVIVYGTHFGPTADTVYVYYTSPSLGWSYEASGCVLRPPVGFPGPDVASVQALACTSAPGIGTGFTWMITAGWCVPVHLW